MAISFNQITHAILIAMASFLAAGSVAVFKFASNLIYFPIGIFGVSYALAVFPKLSESAARKNGTEFLSEIFLGIRNIAFWSLPIAFLFIILRAHIVRVVLGSGLFDWNDTRLVAAAIMALAAMILFEGLNTLLIRGFYALEETWKPLASNITASLVTVLFAAGALWFFNRNPGALQTFSNALRIGDLKGTQVIAVAGAFALGSVINFCLLFAKLRISAAMAFGATITQTLRPISKLIFASMLCAIAAYLTLLPFPSLILTNTFVGIATQGAVSGLVGFAVYFTALYFLKSEEFLSLLAGFQQHIYGFRRQPAVFEIEKLDGQESGK